MSVTYTTHYEFGKQEDYSDLFSMKVITDNWDSLDTILYAFDTGKQDKIDASHKLDPALVDFSAAQQAALDSGVTAEDVEQIGANKTKILSINTDIGAPTITSSTTLADYANALARGYHTGFFTSGSKPSDAPVSDNCFVDFFVYSANTATMRVYPSGTAYYDAIYYRTKVSGTWQGWFKFQGTAVT